MSLIVNSRVLLQNFLNSSFQKLSHESIPTTWMINFQEFLNISKSRKNKEIADGRWVKLRNKFFKSNLSSCTYLENSVGESELLKNVQPVLSWPIIARLTLVRLGAVRRPFIKTQVPQNIHSTHPMVGKTQWTHITNSISTKLDHIKLNKIPVIPRILIIKCNMTLIKPIICQVSKIHQRWPKIIFGS